MDLNAKVTETGKPGMVVIHKSWCGACKALKPKFAENKAIEEASKDFIMINTLDDQEPNDAMYRPDGGYIPRILFIDPATGKVDPEIVNPGRDSYKYYYPDPNGIVKAMAAAKAKFVAAKDEL